MKDAGHIALSRGMQSFSSIATMAERWNQFVDWVKTEHGVGRMEKITADMVREFGKMLATRVEAGQMSAATAQNYVSAVNRVMELARKDSVVWVSPTKDCGIAERNGIAKENRAITPIEHQAAMAIASKRVGALLELQRTLGLRFEESAKIDARSKLTEALNNGAITVTDGTKGGRKRDVPITSQSQIQALERAAAIQGADRSMIPTIQKYSEFRAEAYRQAGEAGVHFHGERHAFAQERYRELVGMECPVAAGVKHGRTHIKWLATKLEVKYAEAVNLDRAARQQIALELGHGRIGVTNAYLG